MLKTEVSRYTPPFSKTNMLWNISYQTNDKTRILKRLTTSSVHVVFIFRSLDLRMPNENRYEPNCKHYL